MSVEIPEIDYFKGFLALMLAGTAASIVIYILDVTILPFLGNVSNGALAPI
jgi:hypothetical protein